MTVAKQQIGVAAKGLATKLEEIIRKRLADKRLVLPVMPGIAAQCLGTLAKEDYSSRALATIMEKDPALTSRVVAAATSPAYGPGPVTSITMAINRLGASRLREVVMEWCVNRVFVSNDAKVRAFCSKVWEHSVIVGVLTRNLVTIAGQADLIEPAYLTGLLHDVGKPVVASMLLAAEESIRESPGGAWRITADEWLAIVNSLHRGVGNALAQEWQLPEAVLKVTQDTEEYDPTDRRSLANYARLANAIAKMEGFYPGYCDRKDAEAMVMIGRSMLGVDDGMISRCKAELKERMSEIHGAYFS